MKKPINEIKRMQRIAGLITESEYQESLTNEDLESDLRGDLEKVSGEGPILDPSKLNALVKRLADMAQDRSYLRDDRTEFARIAKMLMNNKLADAAQTIIQLDTSPREIMYDEMSQYYPELWDILFDNKQGEYITLAKPKAGLPESLFDQDPEYDRLSKAFKAIADEAREYDPDFTLGMRNMKIEYELVSDAPKEQVKEKAWISQMAKDQGLKLVGTEGNTLFFSFPGMKYTPEPIATGGGGEVPLTPKVKNFINKAVANAKKDGEFENLLDADWFNNELVDELIDLFPDEDYDSASKEVMDYISQVAK